MGSLAKTLVELKARVGNLDEVRHGLRQEATHEATLQQRDTYFNVDRGRLKLRQVEGRPTQLVFYHRPDRPEIKVSQVHLAEVEDGVSLEAILAEALGVRVVVEKTREVWRWRGVQVHLDRVEGLGSFLEFELAVQDSPAAVEKARRRLGAMLGELGLGKDALLAGSYSDLLLAKGTTSPGPAPRGGGRSGR